MKKMTLALCAFASALSIGALASPALAQFNPGNEAANAPRGGGPKTEVEVIAEGPGKATLRFTGVNVNFLNGLPSSLRAHNTAPDDSGLGTANIVSTAEHADFFAKYKFVLRGVGNDWNTAIPGSLQGGTATVSLSVPAGRSATFAVVPLLEGSGKQLWVTHPENARYQLDCKQNGSVTATMLTVQADGLIRIANDQEVARYQQAPRQFWCRGA